MGGINKSISGAVGSIAVVANVTRGMNLTPAIQAALGSIAESGDQRAAFNGILLASAANVVKKPHFNLEVEINDLFIRLGNLRGMDSASALGLLNSRANSLGNITSVLGQIESSLQAVAKNAKT